MNYKRNSFLSRINATTRAAIALVAAGALTAGVLLISPDTASAATASSCNTQGHSGFNAIVQNTPTKDGVLIVVTKGGPQIGTKISKGNKPDAAEAYCGILIRKSSGSGKAKLKTIRAEGYGEVTGTTTTVENGNGVAGPVWVSGKSFATFLAYVGDKKIAYYSIYAA